MFFKMDERSIIAKGQDSYHEAIIVEMPSKHKREIIIDINIDVDGIFADTDSEMNLITFDNLKTIEKNHI